VLTYAAVSAESLLSEGSEPRPVSGINISPNMSHERQSIDTIMYPPFEAYQGSEPYLFVSYAHKDSPSVFLDMKWLNDQGYRVWYDEGIEAGHDWPEDIGHALDKCSVFLVFISPNAVGSYNVRNEINLALKKRKTLIAIHVEPTDLPIGLELQLGQIQAIKRFALPEALYRRRIERVLPATILQRKPEWSKNTTAVGAIEPASTPQQPTPISVTPRPKRISGEEAREKSGQQSPIYIAPPSRLREDEAKAEKVQPRLVKRAPTPTRLLGEEIRATSAQTKPLPAVSPPKHRLDPQSNAKRRCISEMILLISYPAQQLVNAVSAVPRNVVSAVDQTTRLRHARLG
jgi:hypothetical protein